MKGLLAYNAEINQFLEFDTESTDMGPVCHIEWTDIPTKAYKSESDFFEHVGAHIGAELASLTVKAINEGIDIDPNTKGMFKDIVSNIYFVPCKVASHDGALYDINHEEAYSINEVM